MEDILKHPLTLLLLGALISGMLVPAIMRRQQNHQKALELKTGLVSDLSEAIMKIVMAVQYVHLGAANFDQNDFDAAYRQWEIDSAVIRSKLNAYFPGAMISREWGDFSALVTRFYALEGIDPARRGDAAAAVGMSLGLSPEQSQDWGELRSGIVRKEGELIQKVLRSKIPVLASV